MSLASLQAALNSKPRFQEFFDSESSANERVWELKEAGFGNVRKSRWLSHRKADGTKVYKWTVAANRDEEA